MLKNAKLLCMDTLEELETGFLNNLNPWWSILRTEKTVVVSVITEFKSVYRLKLFPETGPRDPDLLLAYTILNKASMEVT